MKALRALLVTVVTLAVLTATAYAAGYALHEYGGERAAGASGTPQASPTTRGTRKKLPWRFAHARARSGITHSRRGCPARPATAHRARQNIGTT